MASDMAEAIRQLVQDKGISESLVVKTIEEFIYAAYKRKYGSNENCVVQIAEDFSDVKVYASKTIVDDVIDEVTDIDVEDARLLDPEAEIGDKMMIEVDPHEFDRGAVQTAKQTARLSLKNIQKDTLYSEFKDKVGEIIIGYHQREKNGNIFVDLGKVEGIMPKKFQSPRESYRQGDRIKALIVEVSKGLNGLSVVLSRTHPEFVRAILELEVPEVYDKTIEVFKIVREAGYRTKIAVYSNRDDVDPVGSCVGLKGVRIQTVIGELEGEKVDVLRYDVDPRRFIRNALLPAEIDEVYILDDAKKSALAVVQEGQLSLAIGKQGLNVRLANRLCDWNIDVKTREQVQEMDLSAGSRRAVSELFGDTGGDELSRIDELPGVPETIIEALKRNGVELIEEFVSLDDEAVAKLDGITAADLELLNKIIEENVEVVEEQQEEEGPYEESSDAESDTEVVDEQGQDVYQCPECGTEITLEMTKCPNCGVEISFEFEDGE